MPPRDKVPPVSVVTEAAVTVELKMVAPVEFTVRAASLLVAPTAPVKVVPAEPLEVVKAYGVLEALLRVPLKVIALLVVPPLVASRVVLAPKVTLLPKVCAPEVVMVPPLMAVVPVEAFCTTEAAVTAAVKVVVPVEVKARAPKAPLDPPPTIPVKVMLPEPEVMVRPLAAEAVLPALGAELRVELKPTAPLAEALLEFRVTPALSTTGPV